MAGGGVQQQRLDERDSRSSDEQHYLTTARTIWLGVELKVAVNHGLPAASTVSPNGLYGSLYAIWRPFAPTFQRPPLKPNGLPPVNQSVFP